MGKDKLKPLSGFRKEIDEIDKEIVKLLIKRIQCARKIGEEKRKVNLPVYRPDREKEVYENAQKLAKDFQKDCNETPLPDDVIRNIYREIMSGSIAAETGPSVAYMGPPASFSHLACRQRFGSLVNEKPENSIPDVFRAVEAGRDARYGIVPVDNTTEGSVGVTLDMLLAHDVIIYSEIYVIIHHNLLFHKNIPLSSIKKIYTNKIAFESCRNWLQKNLPLTKIEVIETTSTAAAARTASEKKDGAALASLLAAETYGLKPIAENVQDISKNMTRFLVIGQDECPPTGDDKTSIICAVKDSPGSLYKMLQSFQGEKINLTRIESRPSRRLYGEYNFFIDFLGHAEETKIKRVLKKVAEHTTFLKVLGSYPRAEIP